MPAARATPVHERHRPETTLLYAIVKEHLAAFLALAAERYAAPLPKYVVRAFKEYLRCGLLEHGFLRVRCESCRKDRLVAFSCRQRGVCPSCSARVMCNTAAHLTDRVLPNVPIRQWVLSLPFDLRIAAARDPKLLAACDRALIDAVFRSMRGQLGLARAKGGAVSFVQRFGSSLNLHVHYHVLVLDGLFVRSRDGPPVFVGAPAPTASDLARVLADVRASIGKWLARHTGDLELGDAEPDALAGCADIATQRGRFTDLGKSAARDDDEPSSGKHRKSAVLDGLNLHAAVRVGADDDVAREKLASYCARPAFALERLSVLPDGRIAYAIKNARKGATHRTLEPTELLARIAALIPPPRHPFLRYHGVLAPASKWRKDIVPRVVEAADPGAPPPCHGEHGDHAPAATPTVAAAPAPTPAPAPASKTGPFSPLWQRPANDAAERDPRAITEAHRRRLDGGRLLATAPRLDWASLLKRTYEVDVFRCPRCHGAARVVAAITEPAVIRKILDHVREPPARAPPSGARQLGEDGVDAADVWLDPEVDVGA
jgi:ribosomal protein S27E